MKTRFGRSAQSLELDALSEKLKAEYLKKYGLYECKPFNIKKNRGLRLFEWSFIEFEFMPRMDYSTFWDHPAHFSSRNPEDPGRVMIYQPYLHSDAELPKIQETVEQYSHLYGLKVRVSREDSWHYPGRTILIEYRQAVSDLEFFESQAKRLLIQHGFETGGLGDLYRGDVKVQVNRFFNVGGALSVNGIIKSTAKGPTSLLRMIVRAVQLAEKGETRG